MTLAVNVKLGFYFCPFHLFGNEFIVLLDSVVFLGFVGGFFFPFYKLLWSGTVCDCMQR